jgi:hypothetical protein
MDKELKNRSGSVSNRSGKNENTGDKRQTSQPGASGKENRQTKTDNESKRASERGTKKGPNNV